MDNIQIEFFFNMKRFQLFKDLFQKKEPFIVKLFNTFCSGTFFVVKVNKFNCLLKIIIMDSIQFADIDFSATNRSRKKTCSKCKSADHILPSCPLNPCGHCKLPGHISSSCPIKKQESYARKRLRQLADRSGGTAQRS